MSSALSLVPQVHQTFTPMRSERRKAQIVRNYAKQKTDTSPRTQRPQTRFDPLIQTQK